MWFEIHQWFEWRWQRSTQLFFSQAFSRTYWTSKQPSSWISIQGETTSKATSWRTRSISASTFESGSISSLIKRGYHWSDSKCDRFYSTSSHWRVKKEGFSSQKPILWPQGPITDGNCDLRLKKWPVWPLTHASAVNAWMDDSFVYVTNMSLFDQVHKKKIFST